MSCSDALQVLPNSGTLRSQVVGVTAVLAGGEENCNGHLITCFFFTLMCGWFTSQLFQIDNVPYHVHFTKGPYHPTFAAPRVAPARQRDAGQCGELRHHGAAAERLSRGSCEVLVDMEYCYGHG